MKNLAVARIRMDQGQLLVFPQPGAGQRGQYQHLYREANGLRWHEGLQAFHAHEPHRWEPAELLLHLAATLRSAFDEVLCITPDTVWEGVSPDAQRAVRAALDARG